MFAAQKEAASQSIAGHNRTAAHIEFYSCELTIAPGSVITVSSEQRYVIRVTDVSLTLRHI